MSFEFTVPDMACGACAACHWFETENHPDFRLLQPETAETTDEDEPGDKKKKREMFAERALSSMSEWIEQHSLSAQQAGR